MPDNKTSKIELAQQLLESAEGNLKSAKQLLIELSGGPAVSLREKARDLGSSPSGRIVEGVFDGQNMVGSDQKKYPVPANYASKSKLVEGDVLKLTIMDDGSFIYKQIGPIERKKVVGALSMDGEEWRVLVGDRSYKVLYASVTYFKGKPGDQATIIIPEEKESTWGAVENILPAEGTEVSEEPSENKVTDLHVEPAEESPTSEIPAEFVEPVVEETAQPPEVTIAPEVQTPDDAVLAEVPAEATEEKPVAKAPRKRAPSAAKALEGRPKKVVEEVPQT